MSKSAYLRAAAAQVALEISPPSIRSDLLAQSTFREEFGLGTDQVIALRNAGLSIGRRNFFETIRRVLAGEVEAEVMDVEGRQWTLRKEAGGDQPRLVVSSGEQRSVLPDFGVLSNEPMLRLRSLEKAAMAVNLPMSAEEEWRNILRDRALVDEEVEIFDSDMWDTPVHIERSIGSELKEGQSSVRSLVPCSRRYFERLVGVYDGSESIKDYASGVCGQLLESLSAREAYGGFLHSLFLSCHAALTAEINVDGLSKDDLVRAYEFLMHGGDMVSRLGAVEVGFRILPERPELEPYILGLVQRIRDDDDEDSASEFKLFGALFVLVDGEISRARLLSTEPPFYRRLASLAHAALIHRQLIHSGIDYDRFCEWAFNSRAEQFYMQSLADMRREPRWSPDFSQAHQIKMDFFGRMMIAGSRFHENMEAGELRQIVLGEEPGGLFASSNFPSPYLPGPLEGREDHTSEMPDEVARLIEAKLESEQVEPASFALLVNSSIVFRIDTGHVELAAKALRLARYRLANVKDKSELAVTLNGLATVAAVTRTTALADELRILVRRYRHDRQFGLSMDEAIRICLVASATREDLIEWREFAGDWLTEFAFDELAGDDREIFHSHLQCLLHAVPELWLSCGKADAALMGLCSSSTNSDVGRRGRPR